MQQVNILQLQGTGDDEYAWENAGVFARWEEAVERVAEMNREDIAEHGEAFWIMGDNVRIEVWDVTDNNWVLM